MVTATIIWFNILRLMAFLQACLGAPHTIAAQKILDKFLGLFSSAPSWALSLTLYLQLWWALLGQAELGSPSLGSGHGPWTGSTRLCSGLPLALTGRLAGEKNAWSVDLRVEPWPHCRVSPYLGGPLRPGEGWVSPDIFKMVCVPLGRPAPATSRRCFLNCGQ